MTRRTREHFLDSRLARLIAALLFVIGLGVMAYLHNAYQARMIAPMPQGQNRAGTETERQNLNPDYLKCHDERVGQVQKMLDEGVIDQRKLVEFQDRAIATCAGQFPPGG